MSDDLYSSTTLLSLYLLINCMWSRAVYRAYVLDVWINEKRESSKESRKTEYRVAHNRGKRSSFGEIRRLEVNSRKLRLPPSITLNF